MLGDGGRTMWQRVAQMGRDTLAAQENLDRSGRDPYFDLLTGEAVRNAVVVFGDDNASFRRTRRVRPAIA
jgi:hypothetical protein